MTLGGTLYDARRCLALQSQSSCYYAIEGHIVIRHCMINFTCIPKSKSELHSLFIYKTDELAFVLAFALDFVLKKRY